MGMAVERAFQVDLRALVDLLSHHLYSTPRVYLRELLQNAADAITVRQQVDPAAAPMISIEPMEIAGDGTFRIHDSGIGLTEPEVHELLATIGRSSKRDELGFARHEFLGQFGIGLLSCFMVASEVRVYTRSARGGPAVQWTGFADGHYEVTVAGAERPEPGTTVSLVPRPGMEGWLAGPLVAELAAQFGGLLPVPIKVAGRQVNSGELPWQRQYPTAQHRAAALAAYAQQVFGFTPLETIDVAVPEAALTGVAFVLPAAANLAARSGHRVYLRRMLLAEGADKLLPEWAFFVRCVVDTGELRPTASREGLYEDDLLADTRQLLGSHIKDWLVRLAATDPRRLERFLAVHHLGVKAVALHDLEMLRIVDHWWPMETSAGPMTLEAFRRQFRVVRYTRTADEFRELAGVAQAQGLGLVNGGYTYDIEIMKLLPDLGPGIQVQALDPTDLATRFEPPDPATQLRLRPVLEAAGAALAPLGCDVVARSFDPPSLPSLYLLSRAAIQADEMREARAAATGFWSGILGAVSGPGEGGPGGDGAPQRPQLMLNLRSPVVGKIIQLAEPGLIALAVQALYGQALLQGHHPLRPDDSALLNRSFLGLLDWAMRPAGAPRGAP